MYKQFGHSSLIIFFSAFFTIVSAGSFSEFKRAQSDSFISYQDENDEIFNAYLKSNWEAYIGDIAQSIYEVPKPHKIPTARKQDIKKIGPIVHLPLKEITIDANENNQSRTPKKIALKKDINFDFFGTSLSYSIPLGLEKAKFYPQTQKGISNFFDVAVSSEYKVLIESIKNTKDALNLNDWGLYLLVKTISQNIFDNQDNSRLLRWFIFNKLNYSVRAGLSKSHVLVMYKSEKTIYATPIYKIDGNNFYLLSNYAKGIRDKVFTYKQNYPGANKVLDLSLKSLPSFETHAFIKTLSFKEYGKKYNIKYTYNKNMIDFMASYPQADYETYFNTPVTQRTYKDIANGLRKHINGMKSSTAINFVLHFVQSAFKYEVDAQQFGREKVMFAEETLYYSASDCEDRAILFAYLVKELFNIGVVGVQYKDHMATALYIPVKGDSVRVNSRRFVLADPTYINSSIGQSMSKYKSRKPKNFIYLTKPKV